MPYLALNPADAVAAPATTLGEPLTSDGETLATMRGRLNLMLGGRPDAIPLLTGWINSAYVDVATSLEIEELKGNLQLNLVVAGKALYLLPKVVRAIRQASCHRQL
jgi:hypothetical protein